MKSLPLTQLIGLLAVSLAFGCGDGSSGTDGTGGTDVVFSADPPLVLDAGERPAEVAIPGDYDPEVTYPLLVILHGAGVTGSIQAGFFRLFDAVDEQQFVLVYPDGINNVWNATDACCDPTRSVDDVDYISGLIEEALQTYNTDPDRVYLMGHSNGGFMSFRMACERSDLVTGIVTLAASVFQMPEDCQPSELPVSALMVHGTDDPTILFEGGSTGLGPYPSADETVARLATRAGCDLGDTTALDNIDLSGDWDGAETERVVYNSCDEGLQIERWTLRQEIGCSSFTCNPHIPVFTADWAERTTDWLFALSR
ncbi:MAG: alpha/beta fold hydrolase [Myxococcota bacterium]